jgi:hypothetical protein
MINIKDIFSSISSIPIFYLSLTDILNLDFTNVSMM